MAVYQEHIVEGTVSRLEDALQYDVILKAEIPIFRCYNPISGETVFSKEMVFRAKPRSFKRILRRELRKAQKRYDKLVYFRVQEYNSSFTVNLTHKL